MDNILKNDEFKKIMSSLGNGMTDSNMDSSLMNIQDVMQNPQFKSILTNVSGSLGLELDNDTDELMSVFNNPDFANNLMEMTSNLNVDNIVETAGGMFGVDHGKLEMIKNSISNAKDGLSDMINTPSDVSVDIEITQSNAYMGFRKKMSIKRLRYIDGEWLQEKQKLVLTIPSGTRHGKVMKITGEGDEYMNSTNELKRCNLLINVKVKNDPHYQLVGDDFYYKLDVDISDFDIDKSYEIKFLDSETITLFKPCSFPLRNRLIGVVDNLGMVPDSSVEESTSGVSESLIEHTIGKLFILFNLKLKPRIQHSVPAGEEIDVDDSLREEQNTNSQRCDTEVPSAGSGAPADMYVITEWNTQTPFFPIH